MGDMSYLRFSVFSGEAHRPMLAMGVKGKAFFWDLQTLEDAGLGEHEQEPHQKDTATSLLQLEEERENSVASTTESVNSGGQAENGTKSKRTKDKARIRGYSGIGNPFRSIVAHKAIDVPKLSKYNFRQFAWSNDGQWCVGSADHGYIHIFHRNPLSSSEP
jgi:polycomb protein EED